MTALALTGGIKLSFHLVQTSAQDGDLKNQLLFKLGVGDTIFIAYAMLLAPRRWMAYYLDVPDKEGARLGRLNTQSAHTALRGFFTCVCLRTSPMSGGGREAFGLAGFFGCQSTNPVICRSPRLVAGRGVSATQGGNIMPSIATSQHSREFALTAFEMRVIQAYQKIVEVLQKKALAFALVTVGRFCGQQTVALPLVTGGAA